MYINIHVHVLCWLFLDTQFRIYFKVFNRKKPIIWVLLVLQEDANSTTSGWGVETVKVEMYVTGTDIFQCSVD